MESIELRTQSQDRRSGGYGLPLAFPFKFPLKRPGRVLAADIGGSKTRLALFTVEDERLKLEQQNAYSTRQFNSFGEAFETFKVQGTPEIHGVCLGVAGPVVDGRVQGTNFPWKLEINELYQLFKSDSVFLMNDMEAGAYGLASLSEGDLRVINPGVSRGGNSALISPGTGLGEAGLFYDGNEYRPFATEGGHCDFSPRTTQEYGLWAHLQEQFGRVSWERLISGPGIVNIYQFLRSQEPSTAAAFHVEDAETISKKALEGSCTFSMNTMELFFKFLAVECAQLALKFKAGGGIYISGGIIPKVIEGLDTGAFKRHFTQAGRMAALLEQIPIFAVMQEDIPLRGSALYACEGLAHA